MMFTAILVACHMLNHSICIEIVDTRGPYRSEARCLQRIEEMQKESRMIMQQNGMPFVFVAKKCDMENNA